MLSLHENIRTFEKIEKEYGSFDSFVLSDTINNIAIQLSTSNSRYKLKQIGFALALEYLRNVGLDVGKPDLHIRRILSIKRLGYSKYEEVKEKEAVKIIDDITRESENSPMYIDLILWSFCSNICGESPKCDICNIRESCKFNK